MNISQGFDKEVGSNKVCKIKIPLYVLKQSPRIWFGKFIRMMIDVAFKQTQGDHTLFIKYLEI